MIKYIIPFLLLLTFSLYSQDRLLVKGQYIIDLAEVKDAAFVTLSRPYHEGYTVLTKFTTPGDLLFSKDIRIDSFERQDISTMEYDTISELIYLFGTVSQDSTQFFAHLTLDNDFKILDIKYFPVTPFYGSVNKTNIYNNDLVISLQIGEMANLRRASAMYIYNLKDNTFKEELIDKVLVKDAKYFDPTRIILDIGTSLLTYNQISGTITSNFFPNKQSLSFGGASELHFDQDNKFYFLFSPAGLARNVHPDIEKTHKYSGVLYKLTPNFLVEKFKRLGNSIEIPAPTKGMEYYDKNNIFLGVINYGFLLDQIPSSQRYFTVSKITSELEVKWEKTIIPNFNTKYIWLQGIEVIKNGTCLAYGRQGDDVFFTKNIIGFVMKFDENGDIIPLGDLTDTKTTDFYSIKMYPNPVVDQFIIELENNQKQLNFKLFDAQGKLVMANQQLSSGVNEIDMSTLRAGNYYYQISDELQILKSDLVLKL